MTDTTITIRLNGEARDVPAQSSVAHLLASLELGSLRVAVERNNELVPRGEHELTHLEAGDVVEVVTLVGGG